jgi:hypothetical protein
MSSEASASISTHPFSVAEAGASASFRSSLSNSDVLTWRIDEMKIRTLAILFSALSVLAITACKGGSDGGGGAGGGAGGSGAGGGGTCLAEGDPCDVGDTCCGGLACSDQNQCE